MRCAFCKRGLLRAGALALGLLLVSGGSSHAQRPTRPLSSSFGGNQPVTLNNGFKFFANPNNPFSLGNGGGIQGGGGNQAGGGNLGGGFGNQGGAGLGNQGGFGNQ